ncbi:MAG: glycosyltransferase, partial [Patescibacteria group bacterium]
MQSDPIRKISVVLPAYNEKESLPILAEELKAVAVKLPQLEMEFLLVDDGSTDGSPEIISALCREDRRFKGIVFKRNFGQTAAMSCGIKLATGDVIIPMDADLQNDPADITLFLEKIREGYYSAIYFNRTKYILEQEKNYTQVTMQVFQWHQGSILCGVGEVIKLFNVVVDKALSIRAL